MYEYGYNNYSLKNIINENDIATQITISNGSKNTKNLDLLVDNSIIALIKNSELNNEVIPEIILNNNISAPIEEGNIMGYIKYNIDDVDYTVNLIASHNVEKSFFANANIYIIVILIFIITFSLLTIISKLKYTRKFKY